MTQKCGINTPLSANYFHPRIICRSWILHELRVCLSTLAPSGLLRLWLKWFLLNCSVKSSIPKSQWPGNRSTRLHFWDLAPHVCSLNWAWKTGVIRADDGETHACGGLSLCLFIVGDVLLKLRWWLFIALLEGNVWVITLYIPVVGPSTRASGFECGCLYAHLKSLCWACVYF